MEVAVLMPVFNAEAHLFESIKSILDQTYQNLKVYVVNDGSTDRSESIIKSFDDPRIVYLKNEKNSGIVATLNKGLAQINSPFIARMDADDIALPERIEVQLRKMLNDNSLVLCGTQVKMFGTIDRTSAFQMKSDRMKAELVFASPVAHPSVMIRTGVLKKQNLFYRDTHSHLEDYDMWFRLAAFGNFCNTEEALLKYRIEGQNITHKNWDTRLARLSAFYKEIMLKLGIEPSEENIRCHLELSSNSENVIDFVALRTYTRLLISQNKIYRIFPGKELNEVLDEKWNRLFFYAADSGLSGVISYYRAGGTLSLAKSRYLISKVFRKV